MKIGPLENRVIFYVGMAPYAVFEVHKQGFNATPETFETGFG